MTPCSANSSAATAAAMDSQNDSTTTPISTTNNPNNANKMSVVENNFEAATFKEVDVNEQGQPIGLFGIPWKDINQKALRPLGKLFNILDYSNMRKKQFIDAIAAAYINRDLNGNGNNVTTLRKQRQCP